MSDDDCDQCEAEEVDGPDLNEIMASIDQQVVDGLRRALRQNLYAIIQRNSDEPDEVMDALGTRVDILVADMRRRVAEHEDAGREMYPLAEVWRGWVESRTGQPHEFTSSVVRRGRVAVFFSSESIGRHPRRFAEEVDRDEWEMTYGSPIRWDVLEGDVEDDIDGLDAYELDAEEEWDRVIDGAVGDHNGTKYTLNRTENGDILLVPEGMVYLGEGSDQDPDDVEDPEAYFSWPKNTIPKKHDPRVLGWEIGMAMLGDEFDITRSDEIRASPYWNTLLIYVSPGTFGSGPSGWSMTWMWASK